MTRHRKTDAHIATIRVSVPISAMDAVSVQVAADAIDGIQAHLPPGSTVEVLNSRFGRVDAPVAAPAQMALAMSEIASEISAASDTLRHTGPGGAPEPEIPESLRRVPRPAPNGPDAA